MGSSKRKSSFRIDDILHQQTENYRQSLTGCNTSDKMENVSCSEISSASNEPSSNGSYGNGTQIENQSINFSTNSTGEQSSPKKPLPLYPQLADLQKTNFCFPYPFAVPPMASSYLEHYASALHKASPRFWPFYPHPYGGYFMSTYGSKRKGGQVRFTPQQTQNLEKRFSNHKYLSPEDRRHLAIQLKLSDRQVKTWFQNRRAKWRRSNNSSTSQTDKDSNLLYNMENGVQHMNMQTLNALKKKELCHDNQSDSYSDSQSGDEDSPSPLNVAT